MAKRILIGVSLGILCLVLLVLGSNRFATLSQSKSSQTQLTQKNDTNPGLTFHGYDCTVDCSGHEAGYEWAEEHGVSDPDDCSGDSQSFVEGCRAYAADQDNPAEDQDNPAEDDDDRATASEE